jgi:uncharacterized protein DUF6461
MSTYAWADEDDDLAWTVAVVENLSADRVLDVYGGSQASRLGELTFDAARTTRDEHFDDYLVLQLMTVRDRVVAIEPNGWAGCQREIAQLASAGGGHFCGVYWSPSAAQILEARDGRVTAAFDPEVFDLVGADDDVVPDWLRADDFAGDQIRASCLTVLERRTGLTFDRAWLDFELPTYRIPHPRT